MNRFSLSKQLLPCLLVRVVPHFLRPVNLYCDHKGGPLLGLENSTLFGRYVQNCKISN